MARDVGKCKLHFLEHVRYMFRTCNLHFARFWDSLHIGLHDLHLYSISNSIYLRYMPRFSSVSLPPPNALEFQTCDGKCDS